VYRSAFAPSSPMGTMDRPQPSLWRAWRRAKSAGVAQIVLMLDDVFAHDPPGSSLAATPSADGLETDFFRSVVNP